MCYCKHFSSNSNSIVNAQNFAHFCFRCKNANDSYLFFIIGLVNMGDLNCSGLTFFFDFSVLEIGHSSVALHVNATNYHMFTLFTHILMGFLNWKYASLMHKATVTAQIFWCLAKKILGKHTRSLRSKKKQA